jgi:AraC-like DNA-binding protein
VACTWTQAAAELAPHRQLVVPDGCADLVWQDGSVRLVGPDRGAWVAELAPGSAIAGVRLRPGAARVLLGRMPVEEVRDQQVLLEGLTPEAGRLTEQLAEAGSPGAAAEVLDAFVGRLAARYEPDAEVEQAVRLLRHADPPQLPELADAVGLSERQLRRRFTQAVGYGPKTLHSILRFQYALDVGRRAGGRTGMAGIAHQAGYADQAHFTREVRRLAGTTPTELLGSRES